MQPLSSTNVLTFAPSPIVRCMLNRAFDLKEVDPTVAANDYIRRPLNYDIVVAIGICLRHGGVVKAATLPDTNLGNLLKGLLERKGEYAGALLGLNRQPTEKLVTPVLASFASFDELPAWTTDLHIVEALQTFNFFALNYYIDHDGTLPYACINLLLLNLLKHIKIQYIRDELAKLVVRILSTRNHSIDQHQYLMLEAVPIPELVQQFQLALHQPLYKKTNHPVPWFVEAALLKTTNPTVLLSFLHRRHQALVESKLRLLSEYTATPEPLSVDVQYYEYADPYVVFYRTVDGGIRVVPSDNYEHMLKHSTMSNSVRAEIEMKYNLLQPNLVAQSWSQILSLLLMQDTPSMSVVTLEADKLYQVDPYIKTTYRLDDLTTAHALVTLQELKV
jgi:hypothetical protein